MQSRHKAAAAGADGFEQLLRYFHLSAIRFPAQVQSTEQKVVYLNERTELVFTPMVLEGRWYHTSAGVILAFNQDGSASAVFPDWRGRYYFVEGDMRRRTYVDAHHCGHFQRDAYSVAVGLSEQDVTKGSLLRRLFSGISVYEACLLFLWCLLGSGLAELLGAMLYQVMSTVVAAADTAAFLEIAGIMAAALLLGLLLLYSGRQIVQRIAQKGTLALLPAIGERLYVAQKPPCPAAAARRLAGLRDGSERLVGWSLRLICGLLVGWGSALCLVRVSKPALTAVLLVSCALTVLSILAFIGGMRRGHTDAADEERYEWLVCRTRDKRFGVQRAFPFGEKPGRGAWKNVIYMAVPLLVLPVFAIAAARQMSLPRFLQILVLSLPAVALPLHSLRGADGAGMVWADLCALLPDARLRVHENVELPPLGSVLELKNVTFAYPGRREPVLKNVSLRLYPGETVGICGGTGSGKTTLAQVMAGLLEPVSGNVYYGGIELARYNPESLLRRIALENGEDIQLLERAPEQPDTRTRVVFSSRAAELAGCDRVFRLSRGILQDLSQGVEKI